MTGTCRFCHQTVIVEDDITDVTERNEAASRTCGCSGAILYKRRLERVEEAQKKIQEMFENYPPTIEVLMAAVPLISDGKIAKVTIDTGRNAKATIQLNGKGNIKINLQRKTDVGAEI